MKHIFYCMIAFLAILSTSCSNDDIVIEKTGGLQSLTYVVNVQNVYDQFDMTSSIQDIIRNQSFGIGVYTLVYDTNGNLVTTKFNRQFTMSSLTDIYELPVGTYTFITIESLSDSSEQYHSRYWDINGIEKLATLQIEQMRNEVYWQFVFGVCTNTVTISDNGLTSFSATPNAIGSLVNLYFYNFDESPYAAVCFGTKDIIDSYRLNPALSESDRYNTIVTDSEHFRARGISVIDGQSTIHIDRYVLESSIDWSFRYAKDEADYDKGTYTYWRSNVGTTKLENGHRYYGGYYFTSTESAGMIYFGDRQGFINWQDEVKNSTQIVPDVYTVWGGSVYDTQVFMTGYNMTLGTQGKAVLDEASGYYLVQYDGKGKEQSILYNYTSESTGLFETDIIYAKTDDNRAAIVNYLNNNYILISEDETMAFYVSPDYTTITSIIALADSYYLSYLDANFIAMSGAPSRFVNPKALNNAIKSLKGKSMQMKPFSMKSFDAKPVESNLFDISETLEEYIK